MTKLLVASTLLFAACGGEDIVSTPLAGQVDGQPWTFVAGHTSAFLSEGEDDFFATLYASSFTPCGFSEPGGNHLIVSIPKTPGDYDMGFGRNMTFVVGDSDNLVTLDGRIVVDSVTDTKVTGGLYGSYSGDNEVNGRFEITICAD